MEFTQGQSCGKGIGPTLSLLEGTGLCDCIEESERERLSSHYSTLSQYMRDFSVLALGFNTVRLSLEVNFLTARLKDTCRGGIVSASRFQALATKGVTEVVNAITVILVLFPFQAEM